MRDDQGTAPWKSQLMRLKQAQGGSGEGRNKEDVGGLFIQCASDRMSSPPALASTSLTGHHCWDHSCRPVPLPPQHPLGMWHLLGWDRGLGQQPPCGQALTSTLHT